MSVAVHHGDCLEVLRGMEEASVDAVVTDPPYLLEFMGKEFDRQHHEFPGDNPGQKMQAWHYRWAVEVFRVLKPGGHIMAFGGDRTFHRLYSALEDAGFQPRHTLSWIFGQGFPKSLNVAKKLSHVDWCECDEGS